MVSESPLAPPMLPPPLPVVWSPMHAVHEPADREFLLEQALHRAHGESTEFTRQQESWVENPRRVDRLLQALKAAAAEVGEPATSGGGGSGGKRSSLGKKKGRGGSGAPASGGSFRIALQEAEPHSLEESVLLVHDQ